MEKVLIEILDNLDKLTMLGKEAERMAAIKSMVRELIKAIRSAPKSSDTTAKGDDK